MNAIKRPFGGLGSDLRAVAFQGTGAVAAFEWNMMGALRPLVS